MASVSLYLSRGADDQPDEIGTGTNAPGSGDLEVRINLIPAGGVGAYTKEEIVLQLTRIIELIEDQRFTSLNTV